MEGVQIPGPEGAPLEPGVMSFLFLALGGKFNDGCPHMPERLSDFPKETQ